MEQAFRACFILSTHMTLKVIGQSYPFLSYPADYRYQDYSYIPQNYERDPVPEFGQDYSNYGIDYSNPEISPPVDNFYEDLFGTVNRPSTPILKEQQVYSYPSDYGRFIAWAGVSFVCMKKECKKGESKKMRKIADKVDSNYFTDVKGLVRNQDVKKVSKGMRYILDKEAKTDECKMCICSIISEYSIVMKEMGILEDEGRCVSDEQAHCLSLQGAAVGCMPRPTKKGKV